LETRQPDLRDALREMKFLKRRLKRYVQTERYPAFHEAWGFTLFIHYLRTEPETCFDEHAKKCLCSDKIKHLTEKFPRTVYQISIRMGQSRHN
jgi:hypothetical protein